MIKRSVSRQEHVISKINLSTSTAGRRIEELSQHFCMVLTMVYDTGTHR